jgi:hypothetical protein
MGVILLCVPLWERFRNSTPGNAPGKRRIFELNYASPLDKLVSFAVDSAPHLKKQATIPRRSKERKQKSGMNSTLRTDWNREKLNSMNFLFVTQLDGENLSRTAWSLGRPEIQ